MSRVLPPPHEFTLPSRRAPGLASFLAQVGPEGAVLEGAPFATRGAEGAEGAGWPFERRALHETGSSAFGVALVRHEEAFAVHVPFGASVADWDLGLRCVRALASALDAPVLKSGREAPFDWVELVARFHGKALLALLGEEFDATARAAAAAPFVLDGVVREVHVGPRTVARVREGGPPEERGARFGDLVGRLQWLEYEGAEVARVLDFRSPDGRTFHAAVVVPGRRLFLPDTRHVLFADPISGEAPVVVAREQVPAVLGDEGYEPLDETQGLALVHRGDAWDAVFHAALNHAVVRVQATVPDAPPADPDLDEDDEPTEERPTPPLPPPPDGPRKRPWWRIW